MLPQGSPVVSGAPATPRPTKVDATDASPGTRTGLADRGDIGTKEGCFATREPLLQLIPVGEPWADAQGAKVLPDGTFEVADETVQTGQVADVRQFRGLAHLRSPGELVWEIKMAQIFITDRRVLMSGRNLGLTIHHNTWKPVIPLSLGAFGAAGVATQISKSRAIRRAGKADETVRPVASLGFASITAVDVVADRGVQLRCLFDPLSDGFALAIKSPGADEMARWMVQLIAQERLPHVRNDSERATLDSLASGQASPAIEGPLISWSIPSATSLPSPPGNEVS